MKPGRRIGEAFAVTALALALSSTIVMTSSPDSLRPDQIISNLMVLKALQPDLLTRDALYGLGYERFYVPLFLDVQGVLSTDGDPVTGLRRLGVFLGALFLAAHYVFFRSLGAGVATASVATLGSLPIRNALGGEYWGWNGLREVDPRSLLNAVSPLLLLLLLRGPCAWRFLPYAAVTGLLVSLHPVSALHLFQVGAISHLILERGRLRAWLQAAGGAILFVAGALPFLQGFLRGRDNVADPALFPLVREAQLFRWPYLFLPPGLDTVLSVAFHTALPAIVFVWAWRRHRTDLWPFAVFAFAALGLAVGTTALIQVGALLMDRPFVTYQQLRMAKLVYPALLAGIPFALHDLWARGSVRTRAVAGLVVVLLLVPPGDAIHIFSEQRRHAVKRVLGIAAPAVGTSAAAPVDDVAPRALAAWARRETPRDALFFTDSSDFRNDARRSTTFTFKDGGVVDLAGTRPLVDWYRHMQRVQACRAEGGGACWFALARSAGADYVIVDPPLTSDPAPPDFIKVWERSGWTVWRRRA
jgi:uncharacterized protein DUF6798